MKCLTALKLAAVAGISLTSQASDLLWDNFQGPNGFDDRTFLSDERSTLISDSWVVDDAVFNSPVVVEQMSWIGLRDPGSDPYKADFIILGNDLSVVATLANVQYSLTDIQAGPGGLEVYQGTLEFPDIHLPAGQYYFGARLADSFLGRNFAATSGNGNILGSSMGFFKSAAFGFTSWTPVDQALSDHLPSDFAFRINGTVTPEPSALLLVLAGPVLLYRRNRA